MCFGIVLCMTVLSISELEDIVSGVGNNRELSDACYEVNKELERELESVGVEVEFVEGEVYELVDGGRVQQGHYFCFVPSDCVSGVDGGVIVDATCGQFTESNKEDSSVGVKVSLEDVSEFADSVVVSYEDPLYDRYGL